MTDIVECVACGDFVTFVGYASHLDACAHPYTRAQRVRTGALTVDKEYSVLARDPVALLATRVQGVKLDDVCPVCLEPFESLAEKGVMKTKCQHYFCGKCIKAWCNKVPTCPLCKTLLR